MAISRFINSTIANGFPKYQKLWDGIASAFGLRAGYLFGGMTAGTYRNIIQQLDFRTEVNATIAATLSNKDPDPHVGSYTVVEAREFSDEIPTTLATTLLTSAGV
jgi:hypothetical protein